MLVWVTGVAGAGKSTVCADLTRRGYAAVDADGSGVSGWTDRATGQPVDDPPDPVPPGWLFRYGWTVDRAEVESLAARSRDGVTFLAGSAENEADVIDLFDLVVCLVIDDRTLRARLATRTTNTFGRHPEELAAALAQNSRAADAYRRRGAVVVDATLSPGEVVDVIIAGVEALLSDRG